MAAHATRGFVPGGRATPWSAKALTREVTLPPWRGEGQYLLTGVFGEWRMGAVVKGGARWTLIVRAEVGPFRRCPCHSLAHADAFRLS